MLLLLDCSNPPRPNRILLRKVNLSEFSFPCPSLGLIASQPVCVCLVPGASLLQFYMGSVVLG